MNVPSIYLFWLSFAGGIIAILRFMIDLVNQWRNRRKLDLRVISSICYYKTWQEHELENVYMPAPGQPPIMKPGDWKEAFCVLEFVVKNNYPTDITLGRFVINGWIFEDKYFRGMYMPKRDYRVFNLFTREPTSLDEFHRVKRHESIGFRLEILEKTSGPDYEGSHARYVIPPIRVFSIEFLSDYQSHRAQVRVKQEKAFSCHVYHWSDLIDALPDSSGSPLPQGVKRVPVWRVSWHSRFLIKFSSWLYLAWYGVKYPTEGQKNRVYRLFHRR